MKKFAIYLPQFHQIKENDEWWGEGFTEWVNVKNARPLYKGHIQPKCPYDNNYYDLIDKKTVVWQNDLMREYGIDGFIYYHYYFNGKLLLEKPAENLLKWKDIDQPFFFCWANHPWIKSWKGSREVIMPLEYGVETDWENHFQYLLPFFKDNRYEKKGNKPLFMIFKTDFNEKKELFSYFDKRCKDEGFEGICLIESFHGYFTSIEEFEKNSANQTEYIFYREPLVAESLAKRENKFLTLIPRILRKIQKKPRVINGSELMRLKIDNEPMGNNVVHGLWFEWDNTPRHKERGYVITPYTREEFDEYMDLIKDEEYLFINAWNEWAEGMMIEPTEEDGYKYLEWIKEWS